MRQLNRAAGEVYAKHWKVVHALTDVTGFGLLGHLDSAMRAANLRARLDASAIRVLPQVRGLALDDVAPAGSKANLAFVSERATFPAAMSAADRVVLADAQTNGGLLAAVPAKSAAKLLRMLADAGAPAAVIGEVVRAKDSHPGIDVEGEISSPAAR
jgi:selenide,water dikinase